MGGTLEHEDYRSSEMETRLETHLQARLGSRVCHLRVICRKDGVIVQGRAPTYYVKQLAQNSIMEITDLPILANEIDVS
jgi:hypothetical protein